MVVPSASAFGPNGSFFLQNPDMRRWRGLPDRISNDLKNGSMPEVLQMALGANGSYFVSYRRPDGGFSLYTAGLPAYLDEWLHAKNAQGYSAGDIQSIRLSLGPDNESFFVHDRLQSRSRNLPEQLLGALSKLKDGKGNWQISPRIVALGPAGTYVMVNERNGGNWMVKGVSERLDRDLEELKDWSTLHDVILSTYMPGCFITHIAVGQRSGLNWTVPTAWIEDMKKCDSEIEAAGDRAHKAALIATQQAASRQVAHRHTSKGSQAGSGWLGALKAGAQLTKAVAGGLAAANGGNYSGGNYSGGGGGGGYSTGGASDQSNNNSSFDMSSFWSPIDSAGSDPIQ